jgi:SAM-dependent methyltransferase
VSVDRNPQAEQMADESMVRNLAAQIDAIWPQEREIVARIALPEQARVLDVGCGTGEFSARFLADRPGAHLIGIDIDEQHLVRAREKNQAHGDRAVFALGDAFDLHHPDGAFDLVVCRHLVQAVPDAEKVFAELLRVTRPGGRLHVLAEDYGLMHFAPTRLDSDRFWREGAMAYASATGTDLRIGRKTPALLASLGGTAITCDWITIDTLRVPRAIFAAIWTAWRDGYTDAVAEKTTLSRDEVWDHFQDMIACIENPNGYACWHLPAIGCTR